MESKSDFIDDIPANAWLNEIDMAQYTTTFSVNFTNGGKFLSRKRLAQLRLQDFPKMNITNFDHQKLLIKHVKKLLSGPYIAADKLQQVVKYTAVAESKDSKSQQNDNDGKSLQEKIALIKKQPSFTGIAEDKMSVEKKVGRQRFSFDDKAWEAINKSRGQSSSNTDAVVRISFYQYLA
jgi:hypothetical protein